MVEGLSRLAGYKPRVLLVNPHFSETSWAAPDQRLGWINRTGTFASVEPGGSAMSFAANGTRSSPVAFDRSQRDFLALLVGCSFTQGYSVADQDTFANYLNEAFPAAKVVNFGTGGYGTYQSLLRARLYLDQPHDESERLVIYGLIGDHLNRNVAVPEWIFGLTDTEGHYFVPPFARFRDGKLIEQAGGPVQNWLLETNSAAVTLLHRSWLILTHRVSEQEKADVLRSLIVEMNATTKRAKARLLVVGLAIIPEWFKSWSTSNDIAYVDCQNPSYPSPGLAVGGVGHPNAALHKFWGECIARELHREKFSGAILRQ